MNKGFLSLLSIMAAITLKAALLAPNGQAFKAIVAAPQSSRATVVAAKELQKWLEAEFQTKLPIVEQAQGGPVIRLGAAAGLQQELTGKPADAFVIRAEAASGDLCIAGVDAVNPPQFGMMNPWRSIELYNDQVGLSLLESAGTLDGVYAFLEDQCGIRFYGIGPDGTDVPANPEIRLSALQVARQPHFAYRYPWIDFLERDPETAWWQRRVGFGAAAPVQIIHAFSLMLPYKDAHPEWFALLPDGKRSFNNEDAVGGGGNLCLHNEEMEKAFVELIAAYFKDHPDMEIFPMGASDGLIRICMCPQCQADLQHPHKSEGGEFSWHIWSFVNRLAKRLAVRCPGKWIGCLAYEKYSEPPVGMAFEPNVAVMLCHSRNSMINPVSASEFHARIEGWLKYTGRLYCWDWYLTHWPPTHNLPILYSKTIQNEIRYLAAQPKILGEFIEDENRPDMYEFGNDRPGQPALIQLNLYLTAKLLWDPSRNVQEILEEFYQRYYGPAAAIMKEFWTSAEDARNAALLANADASVDAYFDAAQVNKLNGLLAKALAAAPKDTVYQRRLAALSAECSQGFQRLGTLASLETAVITAPKLPNAGALTQLCKPQHFRGLDGQVIEPATWFYAGYDRGHLYFEVLCYEPDMAKLVAKAKGVDPDKAWEDDCVEIFLCPDLEKRPEECYHLILTAGEAVYDGRQTGAINMDLSWNSNAQVHVTREASRWVLKISIPVESIGISDPNFAGDLAFQIYRTRQTGNPVQFSAWSPTGEGSYYQPAKFGILKLQH